MKTGFRSTAAIDYAGVCDKESSTILKSGKSTYRRKATLMSKSTNREHSQINNRREFLKHGATAAAGLGLLSLGLRAQPSWAAGAPVTTLPLQDKPRTHNMLVVGEQTAYLSHLPMFDSLNQKKTDFTSPHRYQVILEATFAHGPNATNAANNLTETYLSDRRSHPTEKMYSINPALFVLPDLDPNGKALKSFRGNTVYRGHLERENTPIIGFLDPPPANPPAGGVFDVNVTRVVHFHKFSPTAAKPAQLQYLLFGKGAETFLAHFIAAPPDFDQVIGVKLTGQQFTDEQLASGIVVNFPGKLNTAKTRLRVGEKASTSVQLARFDIKRPPTADRPGITEMRPGKETKPFQIEVIKEFYFEEGELRTPPTFDPTAEEKKSGFLE